MKAPFLPLALLAVAALTGCKTAYDLRQPVSVGPNPESVTRGFDDKLFVSIMGASRKPGDGDGKIVRVDGDKVTDFVTGLNDPKGLVYVGGYLITADFDTVWKIDAAGRKFVLAGPKDFPSPPTFLNDVAVTPDQCGVLVTDMGATSKMRDPQGQLWPVGSPEAAQIPVVARVVRVNLDGKVTEVIPPTPRMLLPNGVDVLPDGRIRVAEFFSGDILEWNLGLWKTLATGHRSADGLVHDSQGRFYVSEVMTGKVFRYNADGSGKKQLGVQLTAAADHYLDEANDVLIVPETKAGRIVFVSL